MAGWAFSLRVGVLAVCIALLFSSSALSAPLAGET
jgi:hypothetical protein